MEQIALVTISPESISEFIKQVKPLLHRSFGEMVLNEGFSAFLGAFFPVLIGVIVAFYTKVRERKVKHYNAVIFYESLLNDYLGIAHDNVYLIDFFISAITKGHVYWSELHILPIDKTKLSDLHNIGLINDLNGYFYGVRKINDDIVGLSHGYSDLKNALINRLISPDDYILNARIIAENLELVKKFTRAKIDDTIVLLAKIRIIARKDKDRLTRHIMEKIDSQITPYTFDQQELNEEMKKLRSELKESGETSIKENEKIKKDRKKG